MQQSQFISVKPANDLLLKHIAYYYFHSAQENAGKESFIYYPNHKNALTVYKHSRIVYALNYSRAVPDPETEFSILYSGVQTVPRLTDMIAPFQKIGIVFQPLGINHLIQGPLQDVLSQTDDKSFDHLGDGFLQTCEQVYKTTEITEKVALLDDFFLSRRTEFNEPLLTGAVDLLQGTEKHTVQSLAETLHTNRRNLLRIFRKNLGCSVKDYIKIMRFRKTMNDYLLEKKDHSLTELAHHNEYYDQSELIHHFRQLTGNNPGMFFKQVSRQGQEDTFWNMD